MAGLDYVCRDRLRWPAKVRRTHTGEHKSSATFRSGGRAINIPNAERRLIAVLEAFTKPGQNWRTTGVEMAADCNVGKLGGYLADGTRGRSGDPGVVLSFVLDGKSLTLPCDRYDSIAGNLAAIAAHLEALRGIERWGVATVEQMLSAHAALPQHAGDAGKVGWWDVLGVAPNAPEEVVRDAYRVLIRKHHPDNGGSAEAAAEINRAFEEWRASR